MNPLYFVQREQYFEIKLKKQQEYKSLQNAKDLELCCGVSNGFWRFVEQEIVAKIKLTVSCFCDKEHIDLRSEVAYQTQFDPKFGDEKAQNVACFKACKTILTNAGLSPSSAPNDATVIKVASEVVGPTDKSNQASYLNIDADAAQRGMNYLDEQLESGFPILVGVDHTQGNKYNEGTTDHFIVIVGRGCDDNKAWYLFYEVGTRHDEIGMSDTNKLTLNSDKSLTGTAPFGKKRRYVLTQIRKNNKI